MARADLVNDFREQVMYFNTFGGNPVQCAVGMAVLDVIEQENLQENAHVVGEYIRDGLRSLQSGYDLIGDVRGPRSVHRRRTGNGPGAKDTGAERDQNHRQRHER